MMVAQPSKSAPMRSFGMYSRSFGTPYSVGVRTRNTMRTMNPAAAAPSAADTPGRRQKTPRMNGAARQASIRSNASVSRMPVWLTRIARKEPKTTMGIMARRVHLSSGSGPVSAGRRTLKMLRTAMAEVARIAPDAVENEAATMPDSTRIAMTGAAWWGGGGNGAG